MLDFTPNAVHSGIYAALREGFCHHAGIDLTVRRPGESADAPKLLESGRVDFAILDIHDLGIARKDGLELVGVMPIVQRPLAAVIASGDGPVRRPRDLENHTVGVTGLPSDEAVVDSEVSADGGDPARVKRVTIGFNAVASLAAGKVDAATGFWNAEAVALRRLGTPIRVFKVDQYGAPRYPELVLCTSKEALKGDPSLVRSVVSATTRGYRFTVARPNAALGDLLEAVPSLDRDDQQAQMKVLLPALAPAAFDFPALRGWARWDRAHGVLAKPLAVRRAFVNG
jgi:ABC-type nitrate/sulfonate/bicarbonate transport system substrate-binding protein